MVKTLHESMHLLVKNSIEDIFSKINSEDIKNYEKITYNPIFKSSGSFDDLKKHEYIDFKRLMHDYKNILEKKPYYIISFLALKNTLVNEYKKKHIDTTHLTDETVHKELRDFLVLFLNSSSYKKFNNRKFKENFLILQKYLENELDVNYCFATLLNFDGNFQTINLDNNLHIRKITADEFAIISEIKNRNEKIDVDPSLFKIKFVIGSYLNHNKIKEENVKKLFEKTIDGLKIFQKGDVTLGGIYFRHSQYWKTKPTFILRREPKIPTKKTYLLKNTHSVEQFKKFHSLFYGINFTKGKYTFLNRSITRFSSAIENNLLEDRVVDFITSLESLYSANEQELSFKFALRISLLLGNNPNNKINLNNFMLQVYNMRSKIVHGDSIPDQIQITQNNLLLQKQQAIEILEDVSRNSIKIFLNLIEHYNTKDDIHRDIENSIFDEKIKHTFSAIIKKSKYVELKFLESIK